MEMMQQKRFVFGGTILSLAVTNAAGQLACPVSGSGITANGTTVVENNCTISTSASLGAGMTALNSGNATMTGGSITTSGNSAYGIHALTGGTSTLNTSFITTSGNGSYGAYSTGPNSSVNLNQVTISTASSNNGVGVNTNLGGSATVSNSTITTNSDNGHGISIMGAGTVNVTNTHVKLLGSNSYGISASDNGTFFFGAGSSVETTQNYEHAAYSRTATMTINNSSVLTNALGAYGAYARAAGTINVQNNTSITTLGNTAYGIVAQSASISATDSNIETWGVQSIGAYAFSGSSVTLQNSHITTHGAGAYALYANAATGVTNTISASDTFLHSDDAATIAVNGGISNISLTGVINYSGINRFLFVNTAAAVGVPFELDGPPDPSNPAGPTGVSSPAGPAPGANPSLLTLVASNSVLTGDIIVAGGSSAIIFFNDHTIFTGGIDPANVTIDSTSTWNVTSNSILNNLANAGTINFTQPGTFKTITTNDYLGLNGLIHFNTFLQEDSSPSDLLIINGGAATGATQVIVTNAGGQGALTVGNGILLVDAINGGTTNAATFLLAAPVVAGPYEYDLYRGGLDGDMMENWYLRSTRLDPDNPGREIPNYRKEVSLYAAMPSMALLYSRDIMDTLHQRVGDEEQLRGREDLMIHPQFNGAWTRIITENGKQENGDIYHSGPDFNYHSIALQVGTDAYRREYENGHRDHAGFYGAVGNGHGSVDHLLGEEAGTDSFHAYTLGAYWTHFGSKGWYLDSVIQNNWIQFVANSAEEEITPSGKALGFSIEGGYPFFWNTVGIEPEAQLIYQRMAIGDTQDSSANIRFENTNSLAYRGGIRLFTTAELANQHLITTWLRGSVWREAKGNSETAFSSETGFVPFASSLQGNWAQVDVGITAEIKRNIFFYGTFGGDVYLNGQGHSYNGVAGIRINI